MGRLTVNGGEVWHKNHQGSGTGLDADKLDGKDFMAFEPYLSDARLKTDIAQPGSNLEAEQLLNLIKGFRYDKPGEPQRFGVIAQQLQDLPDLQELVGGIEIESTAYLTVDPISVLFYMVRSLAVELAAAKALLNHKDTQNEQR